MTRFDWPRFLRQHRIDYVTSGPNNARGNLNLKCPWCGEADPSEHLGVNIKFGYWGCLRNSAHRGKSPVRLVQKLINCSEAEARRLVGGDAVAPSRDDFAASFAALQKQSGVAPILEQRPLQFPKEFKPLLNGSPLAQPFISYLEERGYRTKQIEWLADEYKLHYAIKGPFAYRIIIPIHDRYGELLSWTARTIRQDESTRYKTLRVTPDERDLDAPIACLAANNTILGLPVLWSADNPKALLLVEGPFDALKVTAFGQTLGVYAASLFGLNVYPAQVAEVQELASRFEACYLLIDEDAELQRLRLLQALGPVGVKALKIPPNSDDPGAMSGAQVVDLALSLLG